MEESEPATRVNGAFLPHHSGQRVILMGTVIKTNPNGRSVEVKTPDDRLVTINMTEPLDSLLSGVLEFHGEALGKNMMRCDEFIQFLPEFTEKFDMEAYNKAVNIINTIPNPWKT